MNGGHNPPFLLPAGEPAARLAATAMALGITTETDFDVDGVELEPGDRLVLYTDGVTEAENPEGPGVRRGAARGLARRPTATSRAGASSTASSPRCCTSAAPRAPATT